MAVQYVETSRLPMPWATFDMHGFWDEANEKEHVVLTLGDVGGDEPVLTRIHSECLTGDALFSMRCDCGSQLQAALERIAQEGRGALLYLRQEGRGIGLLNKIKAYKLQDLGADTVEANEQLGFGADMRDYTICQAMFQHLKIGSVKLLTNNPRKVAGLAAAGVAVAERVAHHMPANPHNADYLAVKRERSGHLR